MKKKLLLAGAIMLGFGVNAQIGASNAPSIGDNIVLSKVTGASALETTTGSGVTWDFSSATLNSSDKKTIKINGIAGDTLENDFSANSDRIFSIPNFHRTYTQENTTNRKAPASMYSTTNAQGGDWVFIHDQSVTLANYPLNLNSPIATTTSGVMNSYSPIYSSVQPGTFSGTHTVVLDGEGTLKLASATFSNVVRYKITEEYSGTSTPASYQYNYSRVQYEYYDFTVSKLPILIHSSVETVTNDFASGVAPHTAEFVYGTTGSGDNGNGDNGNGDNGNGDNGNGDNTGSVDFNTLTQIAVYPNPTSDFLNFDLTDAQEGAQVVMFDMTGKVVYSNHAVSGKNTIEVSNLNTGIYTIQILTQNNLTEHKVIIK